MALPFRTAKRWITKRVVTPDYTNQLDLFSEAPIETPAPVVNAPARTSGVSHARPRPPQQLDFDVWSRYHPSMLAPLQQENRLLESTGGDGGAVPQPSVRADVGAQDGISPGLGNGARGDSSAGRVFDIEPEAKPSRDFRITDAHRIGEGGLHEKARDNIAAIRLLKTLEAENRDATDEEKAVLARYVGWGGMPNVFGLLPAGGMEKHGGGGEGTAHRRPEYESARASTPNAHFTSPHGHRGHLERTAASGPRQGRADPGARHGRGAFLRADAGIHAGRPPDRRGTGFHHGPHRAEALSRFHDIRQGV